MQKAPALQSTTRTHAIQRLLFQGPRERSLLITRNQHNINAPLQFCVFFQPMAAVNHSMRNMQREYKSSHTLGKSDEVAFDFPLLYLCREMHPNCREVPNKLNVAKMPSNLQQSVK